jgi:hypothetical protein
MIMRVPPDPNDPVTGAKIRDRIGHLIAIIGLVAIAMGLVWAFTPDTGEIGEGADKIEGGLERIEEAERRRKAAEEAVN